MRLFLIGALFPLITCQEQLMAQTGKGQWTAGTQISNLTYRTQNGGRAFSGSIMPSAGYFVADGLVLGTGIPLSVLTQTLDDPLSPSIRTVTTSAGLSPFSRYYIGRGKLKFLIGMSYSYSKTNSKLTADNGDLVSDRRGRTTTLTPSTGMIYFFSSTIGLSTALSYDITHQDTTAVISTPTTRREETVSGSDKSLGFVAGLQIFF